MKKIGTQEEEESRIGDESEHSLLLWWFDFFLRNALK